MKCRTKLLSNEEGQKPYCRSPLACSSFGYCRERNFNFGVPTNPETIKQWQEEDNKNV